MSEVVAFPGSKAKEPAPDPVEMLWVCNCGCTVHNLLESGFTRCAACDVVHEYDPPGAWRSRLPPAPEAPEPVDHTTFNLYSLDNVATFLRRWAKAPDGQVAFAVVVFDDGGTSLFPREALNDARRPLILDALNHAVSAATKEPR